MTQMVDFALSLFSNREVLAVNQDSRDNRPLFDDAGLIAWMAAPSSGAEKYVALFNTRDRRPLDADQIAFSGRLQGERPLLRRPSSTYPWPKAP
jgi:hypothetical protein